MTDKYFLHTPRLAFRSWAAVDFALAHLLWRDPQVMGFVGGACTLEQTRTRLHREINMQREHGIQYWPLFISENDSFAGCCGLRPYKLDEHIYELGVHLRPEFWGKGLAAEAGRAVITYAFRELGAAALFAGHHPENLVSKSLLMKLGFQFTHSELYEPTGRMHPSYLLLKAEGTAAG